MVFIFWLTGTVGWLIQHKELEQQEFTYIEQEIYSMDKNQLYKIEKGDVLAIRITDIVFIDKHEGLAKTIYIPIALLIIKHNNSILKVLKIGKCDYKKSDNITMNIKLRASLNAQQIWYAYYGEVLDKYIIYPKMQFKGLSGYTIDV